MISEHKKLIDDSVKDHDLDCGDNSCRYAKNKTGMRTNGGCRCAMNNGKDVEFYLRRQLHAAIQIIEGQEELSRELQKSGAW